MSDIDVIIPLYNGEKWIKETLDAVLGQSLKPKRMIVVDDHSTDTGADVIASIDGVTLVKNPNPRGATNARNYGIEHSQASMLAFLDQDDVWHPDHLRLLANILADHPKAAAAAARYELFNDGDTPAFDMQNKAVEPVKKWDMYPFSEAMEPSLILFQRWVFDQFTWNHEIENCSDRYMWHQLSVHYPIMRLESKTVGRRVHATSGYNALIRRHPLEHFSELIHLTDKLLEYRLQFETDEEQREYLNKRANIMRLIPDLIKSIINKDKDTLAERSLQLEAILTNELPHIQEKTIEQLFLFMTHHNEGIRDELSPEEFYEFITDHWPMECKCTWHIIERHIIENRPGFVFYMKNILHHPGQAHSYNLLTRAIQTKLSK